MSPAAARRILVDANVLLDVLTDDPDWYAWSAAQLDACAAKAELCINPVVYAEVSVGFERIEELDDLLQFAQAHSPVCNTVCRPVPVVVQRVKR